MKKVTIYMLLAAVLFCSCENPLEYRPADKGDELIVNALLDVGETTHFVQLAVSTTEYVRPVQSAQLRFYVNGIMVARSEALETVAFYGEQNVRGIYFDASFKAGDKLRLEVDADGLFKAGNEQVVPQPPVLSRVDTVRLMRKDDDYGGSEMYYRFDAVLQDQDPSENYFRIKLEDYSECIYFDDGGIEVGRAAHSWETEMDVSDDPILSAGYVGSSSDDFEFSLGTPNVYGAFSDSQFRGGSVTLRPQARVNAFGSVYAPFPAETCSVSLDSYAVVVVQAVPQRYFYYLKALNMLKDGSEDLALEDVQIPDNVEGGIGFVGVSNSASRRFYLGNKTFDLIFY